MVFSPYGNKFERAPQLVPADAPGLMALTNAWHMRRGKDPRQYELGPQNPENPYATKQVASPAGIGAARMVQQAAPPGEQLAYINPQEAQMLKQAGGSGRRDNNPFGIMSFDTDYGAASPDQNDDPDRDEIDYDISIDEISEALGGVDLSSWAEEREPSGVDYQGGDYQGGDEQRRSGYRRNILTPTPVAEADRWSQKALDKYKGTPYGAHMRAQDLGYAAPGSGYSMNWDGKYTGPGDDEYDPNKWNRLKSGMVSELISGNASPELMKYADTLGLNLDQLSPAAGSLAENLTGRVNDYNLWNQHNLQKEFSPEQLAEMGINTVDFTQDQLNTIAEVGVDISLGPTPKDRYLDTASPNVPWTESIMTTLMPGAGIAAKYDPSPRDKTGYPTSIAGSRMQFNLGGLALQMLLPPGIGALAANLTTGEEQYKPIANWWNEAGTATGEAIKEHVVDPVIDASSYIGNLLSPDLSEEEKRDAAITDDYGEVDTSNSGIGALFSGAGDLVRNVGDSVKEAGRKTGKFLGDIGRGAYGATIGQLPNMLPDDFNLGFNLDQFAANEDASYKDSPRREGDGDSGLDGTGIFQLAQAAPRTSGSSADTLENKGEDVVYSKRIVRPEYLDPAYDWASYGLQKARKSIFDYV